MATFFVDGTGLVTTASTVADSIHVQSAALPGSTILGAGGNDTINLLEGSITNASAVGLNLQVGAGADSITISGLSDFSAGNASIYGGAGSDTIAVTGNGYFGLIKTPDDADVLILSGTTNTIVEGKFGKGADSITIEGGTLTNIGLGKGHDHFSAASVTLGTASTINLGEGRDTVVIASMATTLSATTIVGDAAGGTNYGADSISILAGLQSASTVKGQGGDDTITLSGDGADQLLVIGGGQNDVITISGYEAASTIGGGSGADTLNILEGLANSAYFNGGEGADSIALTFLIDHAGLSANQIDGGAGADSISILSTPGTSADMSGAVLPTLQYSALSESNLTTMDKITFSVGNTTGTLSVGFDYGVDLSAAVVTERSALAIDGIGSTFSGNIAAGIVTLSGASQVSSVTAVAASVDPLTLPDGANEIAIFTTTGGEDYLFVQGGSAGTADDSIVSLGDLSGGALALSTTNNTAYLTFSGG